MLIPAHFTQIIKLIKICYKVIVGDYNIDKYVKETSLCSKAENGAVRCFACAHKCKISQYGRGICGVRFNDNGKLMVPFGYVSGLGIDPVEKKPFYHFLPGELAVSFGMLGCNFRCEFCQNFTISQVIKDKNIPLPMVEKISAAGIVQYTKKTNCRFITSTYNEPFVTVEWAQDIFEKAKKENIYCGFVSNGFASRESLKFIAPFMDACNVDLKSFNDANYHRVMGGKLKPVLDTIVGLKELGIWVEVITLVIPGFNDTDDELKQISSFVAKVSKDIPWHVTAFYPAYKWTDKMPTPLETLIRAVNIGKAEGLKFIYAGNITGHDYESTRCPKCRTLLIKRQGFMVAENKLRIENKKARCFDCKTEIAGVWG